MRRLLGNLVLAGAWALAGVSFVGVLTGGSCVYHDDCDDDDDHFDDDDCDDDDDDEPTIVILGAQSSGGAAEDGAPFDYELEGFRLALAPGAWPFPARYLLDVEGVSILAMERKAAYSEEDFRTFTTRLVAANPGRIGPPGGVGALRFTGVETDAERIVASYEQLAPGTSGAALRGGAAGVRFVFDRFGALDRIEDTTVPSAARSPAASR